MTERVTGGVIHWPGDPSDDSVLFEVGGCHWWLFVGGFARGEVQVFPHWFLTFGRRERAGKLARQLRHPGMASKLSVPVKPSARSRRRR